jgi:hypothetical protein
MSVKITINETMHSNLVLRNIIKYMGLPSVENGQLFTSRRGLATASNKSTFTLKSTFVLYKAHRIHNIQTGYNNHE